MHPICGSSGGSRSPSGVRPYELRLNLRSPFRQPVWPGPPGRSPGVVDLLAAPHEGSGCQTPAKGVVLVDRKRWGRRTVSDMARRVLLYDAGCGFCRFAARVVTKLDRRDELALLGLEDASADRLLEHVSDEERVSLLRLVLPDGRMLSGGAAALNVLELLPATRPLARMVTVLHAQRAAEAAYALVARNRDRLGRLVPDGPGPRQYP